MEIKIGNQSSVAFIVRGTSLVFILHTPKSGDRMGTKQQGTSKKH